MQCSLKRAYLRELKVCKDPDEVQQKVQGHPLLLGELDSLVQSYIKQLRLSGGIVSSSIVLAAATGIIKQKISNDDKKNCLATFTTKVQPTKVATIRPEAITEVQPVAITKVQPATINEVQPVIESTAAATACPSAVYKGVHLSSCYSNLYYYPTMHWTLDKTPDTDNYWVGIFKEGASDKDYRIALNFRGAQYSRSPANL